MLCTVSIQLRVQCGESNERTTFAGDHAACEPAGHLAGGIYSRRGAAETGGDVSVLAPQPEPKEAHRHWLLTAAGAFSPQGIGIWLLKNGQLCITKSWMGRVQSKGFFVWHRHA
jgi:hypothetical protein